MAIFGIGTDIVEVARIEAALAEFGDGFAKRILAESEMEAYQSSQIKSRFLAKRFAAKEAFSKAIGTGIRGDVMFHAIAISHDEMGKPLLVLDAKVAAMLAERCVRLTHVSISDEKNLAVAFVVLET